MLKLPDTRSDAGDSLLEVIVSISILSVLAASLIGSIFVTNNTSGQIQNDVSINTNVGQIITNWSDVVTQSAYVPCATSNDVPPPSPLPDGSVTYSATVQYWDGTKFADTLPTGPCTPSTDTGAQLITLTANAPTSVFGQNQTLAVVKRKPCVSGC